MPPRVAIGNNKGGVGKTSVTVNLAAALAEAGRRVLVVDMDPQANASRRLGVPFEPENSTVSEAIETGLRQRGIAAGVITGIGWPEPYASRIDLVPSRFDLENRVSEAGVLGAVTRLRTALDGADDGYDLTLIDCPPSLGHLTQLSLAAATHAVTTVEPEYDAVEGALRYRDFVEANAATLGVPQLRLVGVLVNKTRPRLGVHAFHVEGLDELFGAELVWSPPIPDRAVIKQATDDSIPLRQLGTVPATGMAEVYRELADRLWKAVQA